MPRQNHREGSNTPFFKSFWKKSMICISEYTSNNGPCLLPGHCIKVQKNPHQFYNSNRRVSVIKLNSSLFRKVFPVIIVFAKSTENILQGTGYEEVLLNKT